MGTPNRKEAFFLFYNPSVSSADSSLYTREPNGRDDLGEGAFRDGGSGPREGGYKDSFHRGKGRGFSAGRISLSLCRRGGGLSPGAPGRVLI